MTLAKKAEFARQLGVSRAYITRLGNEGRLAMVGDKVDVEASLALIAATSAGHRSNAAEKSLKTASDEFSAGKQWEGIGEAEKNDQQAEIGAEEEVIGEEGGRLKVRKLRELIMREDRLIDLGLLRGDLLPLDEVNAAWRDIGIAVRSSCEAMVERLAPRLVVCADESGRLAEIRRALAEERRLIKRMLLSGLRKMKKPS